MIAPLGSTNFASILIPGSLPPLPIESGVPLKVYSWWPPFASFLVSMTSRVPVGPLASMVQPSFEITKLTVVFDWLVVLEILMVV